MRGELRKKESALATHQTQSQQESQLTLPLVTASLDPAVTSYESEEGEGTGKQRNTQKILNCSELTDYINQKFNPKKPISKQNIIDAASRKTKKMPEFESDYGFKFLGKIRGEYQFRINLFRETIK